VAEPPSRISSTQAQPAEITDGQATYASMGIPRRISVKGMGGIAATVIVKTYRGHVWMSIVPPFTWEAIMEPGKVDELIHVLVLARDDAKRIAAKNGTQAGRGSKRLPNSAR
jgi:hypothetical protein